ncbi:50S ribosome-binding GTPase [Carpediemonas membranifera]|uniref:50S ribosome-binding GTPase n=1 Tax=Carpediemonas membranifera TaxID=201153 RepID=A0A8J6B3T1_9EUKA|nr:50S ribosome-binding GTPase [Carpediemonas membranifera]|eukprot:KAG9392384.1 50S ribosome-binding GTPase [Carpediemonas membranifera]
MESTAIAAKIAEIEAEMAKTQKNKATEGHLGLLKAKLAKLRRELIDATTKKSGPAGDGFDVTKAGDARVGLIGFPSVGKSTLLSTLTETESEAADYEFTTLTAIPGTLVYNGARIQILDLPGIIEGAKDGKGRGRQVIGTARTCDVILIVLDAAKPLPMKKKIEHELEGFGIRLNKRPPNIVVTKKDKGGVGYTATCDQTFINTDVVKSVCRELKVNNVDIVAREDCTVDQLIDAIEGNRAYIPAVYALNKIDQITIEELDLMDELPSWVPICASHRWNLDELLELIWKKLDMTRCYTKPHGKAPDYEDPVILKHGKRTIEDFCDHIHKAMASELKYALVWGASAKHQPQRVGKEHILADEDIVQIVKRS